METPLRVMEIILQSSVIAIALPFIYKILAKWIKYRNITFSNIIHKISLIHDKMKELVLTTNVDRFLIIKTEDGGGLPKIGSRIYASVLYEEFKDPVTSVKNDQQRMLLDGEYIGVIANLHENSMLDIKTSMLRPSLLKKTLDSYGIVYTKLYFVHQTKHALYYCSVGSVSHVHYTSQEEMKITYTVNYIRNMFEKYM